MFPQDGENFRFRFTRVMALIFLLTCSPTQASSRLTTQESTGLKGCPALVSTWMATDTVSLVRDPNFIRNLLECTKEVGEAASKIAAEIKPIIKELPEAIKKVLPDATKGAKGCAALVLTWMATDTVSLIRDPNFMRNLLECAKEVGEAATKIAAERNPIIKQLSEVINGTKGGLVVLSAYALYMSVQLFNRALGLVTDYGMYHEKKFEELKKEVNTYKDFIVTEIIPTWENGNAGNLQKVTDDLMEKLDRQLKVIEELIRSIHNDAKQAESDVKWSAFYTVIAVVACRFSILSGNSIIIYGTCGAVILTFFNTVKTYRYYTNTLTKLDMLREDANTMRKEITKYRAQLDVATMGGFVHSRPEFSSSATLVNSQLVCLLPFGVFNTAMFNL